MSENPLPQLLEIVSSSKDSCTTKLVRGSFFTAPLAHIKAARARVVVLRDLLSTDVAFVTHFVHVHALALLLLLLDVRVVLLKLQKVGVGTYASFVALALCTHVLTALLTAPPHIGAQLN